MKVIVTGGAGFLGSYLCDKLISEGHQVVCIDNLITGSEENISQLKSNPNFEFINFDVSDGLPKGLVAKQIYHLASPASPNKNNPKSYIAHPFETMKVNTDGTWRLCEAALTMNARLLFASTSEIYGDPKEHPQKETYYGNVSTTGPRSVYDEAKRFGETVVSAFVRSKALDGRIIRVFNTYGPKMADDGRVVIEFVKAALKNEPLPVFGEGTQSRSFCYVDDLIDGIILAMQKGESGEVYNLGNAGEFTILDLAHKVKELTNSTSEIKFAEILPQDDPLQRCPDLTKTKQTLGWESKISLEEGLKRLIKHIKKAGSVF